MQTERYRVFIYGSLLPGMSNHIVVSDYIEAVVPGRIEGRLVDCGAYPALIRSAKANGRSVRGLWIEVGRAGLAAMDALEQFGGIEETNDYERVWAQDLDRPEQAGWVYVWEGTRGFPDVRADFWPDYWLDELRKPNGRIGR
ncbi:gamma-glutamylcyclotransferase family protein [Paenibacillus darwinianus]|uniref:gamma-glutamylcyclotransferase family protein n=2 Tax=Paenibacillus darwinianus TaxID=1380763 RepID=UPI00044B386D|nr:gamma-glutamylcyclotransferase family protein [Paenibacillus darwinianus]EXX88382.1 AIG2 family protein [Paenibacillus darwinianus]